MALRFPLKVVLPLLLFLILTLLPFQPGAVPHSDLRGTGSGPSPQAGTLVLADPGDPTYALAEEIARQEGLPLANSLDQALARDPVFLLWVVSPSGLSDPVIADFGLAMRDRRSAVSVGLVSGSTLEKARDLWQRGFSFGGRCLSAVADEGTIRAFEADQNVVQALTRENLVAAMGEADYVIFHGHGTRRQWGLDEDTLLVADDLPPLRPIVVSAAACQTFRPWTEESIALGFTDRGAAAYAGFVHSPVGYLIGEPGEFPFRHTWPDFPIGHVVQLQNRGLLQGFLHFPFYLLLGDPRLSFQRTAPYDLVDDRREGSTRVLEYTGAPSGVIPVRVEDGARFGFVEIPSIGAAWEGDPFYNGVLQMAGIGDDKYLLFVHPGGDFTVRLRPRPPWYWVIVDPLVDALDDTSLLHHAEGGAVPSLIAAAVPLLAVGWMVLRRKVSPRTVLPAVAAGLGLAALRTAYALARQDHIRTIDRTFELSPLAVIATFLLAGCGTLLFLNARSRWGKGLAVLATTFPNWAIAAFWLGIVTLTNHLARQRYGAGLYAHGRCFTALIAFVIECAIVALTFAALRRYLSPAGPGHPANPDA